MPFITNNKYNQYWNALGQMVIRDRNPDAMRWADRICPEQKGFSTPCWIWKGVLTWAGYAKTTYRGCPDQRLHRVLYKLFVDASLPDDKVLDHLCRNRGCVNPLHVEAVTHVENIRRGKTAKLDWEKVAYIRSSEKSAAVLARELGVQRQTVGYVRRNQTWVV